jgi:HEAT repeat protein
MPPLHPVNEGLTGDTPPLLKLQGAQIEKGISGAALLNLKTGKVCGMVKATRAADFDLGGGAIPTRVILEQFPELRSLQQAFHRSVGAAYPSDNRRWVNLITTQSRIDFQPYLRSLIANEKYQQKWGFYTPTDATSKLKEQKATVLDIELMVRLMQSRQSEDDRNPEQQEKVEQLPVLDRLPLSFSSHGTRWLIQSRQTENTPKVEILEKRECLPVLEAIRRHAPEHVLLMGRPGSGKSTALLQLLVEEARQALTDSSAKIVVLVELRYLDIDRPSVLERIGAFLRSHDLDLEEDTLKTALVEGRLFLLIDGVNELPSETARRVVARFRQDYPQTPMIFTTRDAAISGDLGIEKKLEMQPLTEPQMQQFVQMYLPEQGELMLRQLQGRLREVGQTPLLLWMLCEVFQGMHQIPSSLGMLFQWFAREYNNLKQDMPVSEGFRHWQSDLLQYLTFTMMQAEGSTELRVVITRSEAERMLSEFLHGKVEYPEQRAKEWLEDLLKHHLIQPTSQNQLEFHHQLLQEYYAAEALLNRLPYLSDEQLQRDYLNYLKWTEPIASMLSLVEQEAQALCIVRLALNVDLMLGAKLAGKVKSALQAETIGWINKLAVFPSLKIRLLVETRSKYVVSIFLQELENSNSAVRCKIIHALGELGIEATVSKLLQLSEDANPNVRSSAVEALGKLKCEAAIPGLLKTLEDSDPQVRDSAVEALINLGSEAAIPGLLEAVKHEYSEVRRRAAIVLGYPGSEAAIPELLRDFQKNEIRISSRAVTVLRQINSEAVILELIKSLKSRDAGVRREAVRALWQLGNKAAIPELLKVLQDSDPIVRWKAVEALERLGGKTETSELLGVLQDSDPSVRWRAVCAIGQLGSEIVIPEVLKALQDPDAYIRCDAAILLGRLGYRAAIPELLKLLEDPCLNVRWIVASVLGQLGSDAAIPEVLKALEYWDSDIRNKAIVVLEQSRETAIPGLVKALEHLNPNVRKEAVRILGKLSSTVVIPMLLKTLEDPSVEVRQQVVYALEEANSEAVVEGLLKALQDPDSFVRRTAAMALGKLSNEAAIPELLKNFEDFPFFDSRGAAYSLVKLGSPKALSQLWQMQLQGGRYLLALSTIAAIQNHCKFYNYEIWQEAQAIQNEKLKMQKCEQGAMVGQATGGTTVTHRYEVNTEVFQVIEHNHGNVIGKQLPNSNQSGD